MSETLIKLKPDGVRELLVKKINGPGSPRDILHVVRCHQRACIGYGSFNFHRQYEGHRVDREQERARAVVVVGFCVRVSCTQTFPCT
jgi:hypothetical protein